MKHLPTYQEFINESQSEPRELSRQEFNKLAIQTIGSRDLYRWDPLNVQEEESLVSLYNYLDPNGRGSYRKNAVAGEDLRFRIVLQNKEYPKKKYLDYPRIQIGKLSSSLWTVDTLEETDDIYLNPEFYTFPSLQDAIACVAAKYGPGIEWDQIR